MLLVEVEQNYYKSRGEQIDANVKMFFDSFDIPELPRREVMEAARESLAARIEAMISVIEAGDAQKALEQMLHPAEFEAFMTEENAERELVLFNDWNAPKLLGMLKSFDSSRTKVFEDKAVLSFNARSYNFKKVDGK